MYGADTSVAHIIPQKRLPYDSISCHVVRKLQPSAFELHIPCANQAYIYKFVGVSYTPSFHVVSFVEKRSRLHSIYLLAQKAPQSIYALE